MKQIPIDLKVVKPSPCKNCMCVYKFTLDNGFYYYGATSDLLERVLAHIKNYRNKKLPTSFKKPFESAKVIVFEIVSYANNRERLRLLEEYYLKKNVGLKLCLNGQDYSVSAYKRNESVYKIAKLNMSGEIIKIYDNPKDAAFDLSTKVVSIKYATYSKYPKNGYLLRRIGSDGNIIKPDFSLIDFNNGCKPITQYDAHMNLIATYPSIAAASRATSCSDRNIAATAMGKQKLCKGFIFKFI